MIVSHIRTQTMVEDGVQQIPSQKLRLFVPEMLFAMATLFFFVE